MWSFVLFLPLSFFDEETDEKNKYADECTNGNFNNVVPH